MDYQNQQDDQFKTPPVYKNGPLPNENRVNTDSFFCTLLTFTFLGFIGIGVYAHINGNPYKLVQGYDPDHRACGVDTGVEDYPFIYFATPNSRFLYRTVCVHTCPEENDLSLNCAPNSIITDCLPNYSSDLKKQVLIYDSVVCILLLSVKKKVGNRVCIPTSTDKYDEMSSQMQVGKIQTLWNDIKLSKYILIGSVFFAFFLSFAFIYFLDNCAGCLVYSFFVFIFVMLLSLSGLNYYQFTVKKASKNQEDVSKKDRANQKVDSTNLDPIIYLIFALISITMAFVFLAVVMCAKRKIRLTIAILKAGSEYIEDNKSIIKIPFIVLFLELCFLALWIYYAIYLYSCGQVKRQQNQLPFGQFEMSQQQVYMSYYIIFAGFWVTTFLLGTVEFITSGSVCVWYFQQGKSGQHLQGTVVKAFQRYYGFHSGSVALGSLLLSLLSIVRVLLESLTRSSQQEDNRTAVLKCCLLFTSCCQVCIENINKNAYTQINMTGKNFCRSAGDAFRLMVRNALNYAAILGLGDIIFKIFLSLGRYSISILTYVFTYLLVINIHSIKDNLVYPDAIAMVAGIFGYIIGSLFMSVYGTATSAILNVFCMDLEIESHFGKQQAALCPPALQDFLNEQNQEIDQ